jgi:LysM repeat protein/plastocyanin
LVALVAFALPQTTRAAARTEGAPAQVSAQAGYCTVTVRRGEALYMIAARFHTTTAYLAQINNLWNPNYIYAGMTLKVPCAPQPQPWPQPQPLPQPLPQPQPQPYPICTYYIVQRGDWLKTIAARFGVSWQLLAQVNGLHNANYIYAGQKLAIPCAPIQPPVPPPVCPGCPPCQGCPPVYPTPTPIPPTPVPVMNMVEIRDNFFAPPVITVRQGQYVMWTNRGNQMHGVTQGLCPNGQCTPTPGGFNSGPLNPGATYICQFTQLGTFAYFDPATGSAGTVAVVP